MKKNKRQDDVLHKLKTVKGNLNTIYDMYERGEDPSKIVMQLKTVMGLTKRTYLNLLTKEFDTILGDNKLKPIQKADKIKKILRLIDKETNIQIEE